MPSVFQPFTHTRGSAVPLCTDVSLQQDTAPASLPPSGWRSLSLPSCCRPQSKDKICRKVGLVWIELGRAQLLKQLAKFKAIIPGISAKCHSEFPSAVVCPVRVSPDNGAFSYYANTPPWISVVASPCLSTFPTYSKSFTAQGDFLAAAITWI